MQGRPAASPRKRRYPFVSETDNSCKVCCRDPSGRCVPYVDAEQRNLFLRKGKPCTVGFCDMNVSICSRTAFVRACQKGSFCCKYSVLQVEGNQNASAACPPHPLARLCGSPSLEGGVCGPDLRASPHRSGCSSTLAPERDPGLETGGGLGALAELAGLGQRVLTI